ncbi:hypothetical protein RCL1_004554 [Eukaryota sp. TZLM3-RCL]
MTSSPDQSLDPSVDKFNSTQASLSELFNYLQSKFGTTPLLALIARVLNVIEKQDLFFLCFDQSLSFFSLSSVTTNQPIDFYNDCFYVLQPIEDKLWEHYFYILPFMRLTFSLLHYALLKKGTFFESYCATDSKKIFDLLSQVNTTFERGLNSSFQLLCVQKSLLSMEKIADGNTEVAIETFPITTEEFHSSYKVLKGKQHSMQSGVSDEIDALSRLQYSLNINFNMP